MKKDHQPKLPGFDDDPPDVAATAEDDTPAVEEAPAPAPVKQPLGDRPIESPNGATVYVLDGHSIIYQVFHAIAEMTDPKGRPVQAIWGFIRDLFKLLEEKQPDFLLCALDHKGPTFRHGLYDRYKIERPEMPESLQSQMPYIWQLLDLAAVPRLSVPGFEADDILATVAAEVRRLGGRCVLVTADKDCRQLIDENTLLYNIRKDTFFDAAALMETWGVRPDQVVDFQALVGDPTDNIPGVPLIGPKLARELLEKFDTLEGIYEHLDTLKGKRRENLENYREAVLLSRKLVRLDDRVPIEIDWRAAHVGGMDRDGLIEFFEEFDFQSFLKTLPQVRQTEAPAEWQADYQAVTDREQLHKLVELLEKQERISIDTETTSIQAREAELVGISVAWQPGRARYIPVRCPDASCRLDEKQTLDLLRPVLENPRIAKLGQNLKYEIIVFRNVGVELQGIAFDSMIASYLLDPGSRTHNMDDLAKRYLNHQTIKISELIGAGKKQKRMDEVPLEEITPYACQDADVPLRLADILQERLRQEDLQSLFADVEMPLIDVLADMEFNGIRIDADHLARLSGLYQVKLDALEAEIHALAGRPFNIGSPRQLGDILFDELKLPTKGKTAGGARSTDVSVLEKLADVHPLPAKILEYRQYAKLKNTYVDAIPKMILPATGRVHASFNQFVAATGRLSSSDPNLQNIPVRTVTGRDIRAAFRPADGCLLLAADYSQIELRVLAHFCEDEALIAAFANDEDIHARVAAEVNGVSLAEVTSAMRRQAKAVNFGIIYGQTAFGLAEGLKIDQAEAARFIAAYFARYPRVDAFFERVLLEAVERGYVTTILGRRRRIDGIRPAEERQRRGNKNFPERTAINTVIQGSAADLIKLAMLAVRRRLIDEQLPDKLLLQIHDELVFETPESRVDPLARLVAESMTGVYELRVPLKVDVKYGPTWADCEPWEDLEGL